MRHPGRVLTAILLGSAAQGGCSRGTPDAGTWETGPPARVVAVASLADPALRESSGVAVSRRFPGVLWTHNDAGNPAVLFATDTTGAALGQWTVSGAASRDWEDIGLGPCPAGACLYLGDIGDNAERRDQVVIYRMAEPDPATAGSAIEGIDSIVVRYPDRPRDVEALFVDDSSTVWLVSKGRSDGIFLYRVGSEGWATGTATAENFGPLPIAHHFASGNVVSGGSIATDQQLVVVRTYRDLFFFSRSADGRLAPAPKPNRCDILGLEIQGEAVDWWDDSTLVLTSEGGAGAAGVVRLVKCGE